MNETQKEKLIEVGKNALELMVLEDFVKITTALAYLDKNNNFQYNLAKLKLGVEYYESSIKEFKEVYGLEFNDIQERYNEISSDINKYLQINKE